MPADTHHAVGFGFAVALARWISLSAVALLAWLPSVRGSQAETPTVETSALVMRLDAATGKA